MDNREQRLLVLTLTAKDRELIGAMLGRAGVVCFPCQALSQVCDELEAGAGAIFIPEESVASGQDRRLLAWLARQSPWSDLPILVSARPGADSAAVAQAMDRLGNVTVLERPMRVAALVSAVRTALRARQRQYQTRDHLLRLAVSERELREAFVASSRLAAIVENSDDAIISKTLDGHIRTWNAGAERLFGYTADEVIGRPITILIPQDRQNEEPALLARLRRGERIEHFETVRMTKDGKPIDVSISVSPVRDAQGRVVGAAKVVRDITERKHYEETLRDANRRKDEFLAMLAHELRNPLAPVRNSLNILRLMSQSDSRIDQLGQVMERQVNHMVRLVDDLLEISRITRGAIELRLEPVEAASAVRAAVETSQPLIDSLGHQLSVALPAEPLTLIADPVRLSQIISNLLNNSAKYTEPGGQIWLTVKR